MRMRRNFTDRSGTAREQKETEVFEFKFLSKTALVIGALSAAALPAAGALAADEVNIYSYRQPYLIDPLLEGFTKKTGIKTNIVFAKKGLIERMAAEGKNSPADVLLTVDIGRLTGAVKKGISQPVDSAVLEKNIPAQYRDPGHQWFGLTRRARSIRRRR